MKMKPILFNTDMVRAILDNRKTVTRRVVKPKPLWGKPPIQQIHYPEYWANLDDERIYRAPYRPGDVMYVRETWKYAYDLDENEQPIEGTGRYLYAADNNSDPFSFGVNPDGTHRDSMPWHASIHMPREAARIFLRVTDVRVERLRNILMKDIRNEGIEYDIERPVASYGEFVELWDSTIKPADRSLYGWDANPWVWVIEFERISKEDADTT